MTTRRPLGLHGQVVHELGTRILSGRLRPGTVIDLPGLERELGISRTVLRESLKVLTAKGLVGARQKRGTFVTEPESWNMLDTDVLGWRGAGGANPALFEQLAEVRSIVEPAAAALAARRAAGADRDALAACLDEMDLAHADPDTGRAVEADLAFHAALLRATHNDLLFSFRGVIEHGLRQRDLLVHADPAAGDPVPSHRAVLAAVESGDADAAEAAMRALLAQAARDLAVRQPPADGRRGP
jgi:GntR family transcriptional regulator, galactonate operon transcriptional repressor